MTYGETGAAIRDGLTTLLHQQRVQHRLGGNDPPDFPAQTTVPERKAAGAQIRRYRRAVLTWCLQAAIAGDPEAEDPFLMQGRRDPKGPYDRFRTELRRALTTSTAAPPTLEELSTPQTLELVETWRQIAKGAALGEHDFYAGLESGTLSSQQGQTLLKDAAAITQAVLILDRRYQATAGWENIQKPGRLAWATMATALQASLDPPDYSIDVRGWRPPVRLIRGPAKPGLLGVLQAEHNLLVRLNALPSPINLKKVIESQRLLSTTLAEQAPSPALTARWSRRAGTHELIYNELRNVAGRVGDGARAAAEAANIHTQVNALAKRSAAKGVDPDSQIWSAFDNRFQQVDARLADIIETGIADKTLLRRTHVPRLMDDSTNLIKPVRVRFAPIDGHHDTDLLAIVRERLRPTPAQPVVTRESATSRADLFNAITTRAAKDSPGLRLPVVGD